MDLIEKYIGEGTGAKSWGGALARKHGQTPTKMKCMECGKEFKKKIGPRTYEVKCPKCGSYDTEPTGYGK